MPHLTIRQVAEVDGYRAEIITRPEYRCYTWRICQGPAVLLVGGDRKYIFPQIAIDVALDRLWDLTSQK